jgi:large subunit ribosomal protein L17
MKTHAGRKLSRPTGARHALLRSLATSLFRHEQITTTYAKAREVARYAEGLVAVAKRKDLAAHREVGSAIRDREVRRKLHDVLVARYESRPGGCTRVFRLAPRAGDGAEMAVVKLVS